MYLGRFAGSYLPDRWTLKRLQWTSCACGLLNVSRRDMGNEPYCSIPTVEDPVLSIKKNILSPRSICYVFVFESFSKLPSNIDCMSASSNIVKLWILFQIHEKMTILPSGSKTARDIRRYFNLYILFPTRKLKQHYLL